MIEATCGACGTVSRVGETDLPVGAKFLTCASCKSRVAIPSKTGSIPAQSGLTLSGSPPAGGNRGDVIDLADLPAPKKRAAQPGGGADLRPSSRAVDPELLSPRAARDPVELDDLLGPSGTSSNANAMNPGGASSRQRATGIADLPAPKAPTRPIPKAPPPIPPTVDDLPAPRGTAGLGPGTASRSTVDDLPAPRSSAGLAAGPAGRGGEVADLPAPKSTRGISETGSPRTPPSISDLPMARPTAGIAESTRPAPIEDLPAPKSNRAREPAPPPMPEPRSRNVIDDLPAPKAGRQSSAMPPSRPAAGRGVSDLPAPRGGGSDLPAPRGVSDLPAPKGGGRALDVSLDASFEGGSDLPMPSPRNNIVALPTPRGPSGAELPAPKGFFDDLPMPAHGGAAKPELPAPKGFFDDLPMPSKSGNPELPAPKGFFDDLPQSAAAARQPAGLPAPQGFFDDLPQAAAAGRQAAGLPAPQGFFEDIPQAKRPGTGLFDDLEPARGHAAPLEMSHGSDLDLATPSAASPAGAPNYDELDLSKPSTSPVQFKTPSRQSGDLQTPDVATLPSLGRHKDVNVSLELEEPRIPTQKLGPKRKAAAADDPAVAVGGRRRRVILLGVFAVAVVGGAGGMLYRQHSATADKKDDIDGYVAAARSALQSQANNHWQAALTAARKALELDEDEPRAIGLAAEAGYAGALDDGINAVARTSSSRTLLAHAREAELSGPEIDRALIVESINAKQWDRAIAKLQPLLASNANDGLLQLYDGWALAGRGDTDNAIKAFDKAAAANAGLQIPSLYGRGRAKLASTDLTGARDDFSKVLAVQKDHIGAQVGMAAGLPSLQSNQQESDLLAILARKDIDTADPRVRLEAWVLAGDDARRAGRLDAARDRYNKALAIAANDVSATSGLADTEMRDGKLPLANELITKAATAAPNDIRTQLVAASIEIKLKRLDSAQERLARLDDPARQKSPLDHAHVLMVQGSLAEANGSDQGALDAWLAAAKLAGDLDLTPTIDAIAKLSKLQQKAVDDKDNEAAGKYRTQADQLLTGLAEKAATDPALALTLGTAYLDVGDADKAELWLRRAADAQPKNPDAKFLLAKAMIRKELGKPASEGPSLDDAIDQLRAAYDLDPSRADIGVELAKTYELGGRDPDAGALYDKLITGKDPSLELRSRAGRFYARRGDIPKAAAQGDEIGKEDPANAAGLYLRGEGKLADGKLEDALKLLQLAVTADHEPQYLDAQGRAAEAMAKQTGDAKYQELALHAYEQASAPGGRGENMFNPYAGQGRIYMSREDYARAIAPLTQANTLKPDDTEVLLQVGKALQKLNRKKEALAFLAKANKDSPSFEANYLLGRMYEDEGQITDAAKAYEAAVSHAGQVKRPETGDDPAADAYYRLAQLYLNPPFSNDSAAKKNIKAFLARDPKGMQSRVDEARELLNARLRNVQ
jgi:tetratricopeptide (TPR) repeat protein